LGGKLVDTIAFESGGAAIHRLPDGKTFTETDLEGSPSLLESRVVAAVGGCGGGGAGVLGQIGIDKHNVQADQELFAGAVLLAIATYGTLVLTILASGGIALVLAYFGATGATVALKGAWDALQAANAQLNLDEHNAILQGCKL